MTAGVVLELSARLYMDRSRDAAQSPDFSTAEGLVSHQALNIPRKYYPGYSSKNREVPFSEGKSTYYKNFREAQVNNVET